MSNLNQDDDAMRDVLQQTKVIAVVGYSNKPQRPSYQIAQFLRQVGYQVYLVNPNLTSIDAQQLCYPSLQDIPDTVDLVNIFRRSEYLNDIVDQAIAIRAKTIWAQLGIVDDVAREKALAAGLNVAMNVCIKVEYLRLKISISRNSVPPK